MENDFEEELKLAVSRIKELEEEKQELKDKVEEMKDHFGEICRIANKY